MEKVTEKLESEKRELERKQEIERLQIELNNNTNTLDSTLKTANKILGKLENTTKDKEKLIEENNKLREILEKKFQWLGGIPFNASESQLGTGEKVDNVELNSPDKKD